MPPPTSSHVPLIHLLTAPRPSQLPETLQALTALAPLIQGIFATEKVGDAERRARAAFDVKRAELLRDRAEEIATARAADEAKAVVLGAAAR